MYYAHIFLVSDPHLCSMTISGYNYTGADCEGDAEGMTEAAVIGSKRASVNINSETKLVHTNEKLK